MSDKFMASGSTVKTPSDDDPPELCRYGREALSADLPALRQRVPEGPVRWHEDKLQGFPAGLTGHSRVQGGLRHVIPLGRGEL